MKMQIKYVVNVSDNIIIGMIGFPLYFNTSPFLGLIIHISPVIKKWGIMVIVVYSPIKNHLNKLIINIL